MQSTVMLLSLLGSALAVNLTTNTGSPSYSCVNFSVPISFNAQGLKLNFHPFQNHYDSVAFLNNLTAGNAGQLPSPIEGTQNITINATIAAQYCCPPTNASTTVQLLSHGLGFDRSYWDFGGPQSQYNYIKAATAAGYPVLSYDRLGNGNSTKTDPYIVNALQPQADVLKILTDLLRDGNLPAPSPIPRPQKIIHVGHSYGSQISTALVANYPSISDGLVLSGFAENSSDAIPVSSNFHLAKEVIPSRYGNQSTGYLTWADELANQYSFFHYPNFSPNILAQSEATKSPFSVGEALTAPATPTAPQYSGPVLVISGQYDLVFCEADCTDELLRNSSVLFPRARPFQTYVQSNTGHGLNLHFNATGTYGVITDFIDSIV